MILNQSKFTQAKSCWRRAFNAHHRSLGVPRTPQLVDGSATHVGIASYMANHDLVKALEEAKASFDKEAQGSSIPPEQLYTLDANWNLVQTMVETVCAEQHDWTVIQPECSFEAELPGSMHNCIFKHWLHDGLEMTNQSPSIYGWQPGGPPPESILAKTIHSPHPTPDPTCFCWSPHVLHGRTDAIVNWKNSVWLIDWKTTSIMGEQFWSQWQLDVQPTAYIWGIWKKLGIRPRGVIIGAINRPSDAQVANWNSKRKNGPSKSVADYVSFGREAFLRTEQDLTRFEVEMVDFCNEWELRIVNGWFGLSPIKSACRNYNRVCDYYTMCVTHDQDLGGLVKIEPVAEEEVALG